MKFFALILMATFSLGVRAESVFDILGCKLHVPSSFNLRFSPGGQLFLDGNKQGGEISVMRFSEIKWVNPDLVPQATYKKYGKLESRTSFATAKKVKVFLLTDRHNVLMFYGPAADNWGQYLISCDDSIGK